MPKTVLQVLPSLVTGGVERGAVDVAAALAADGWTAVVASAGGPMVREIERAGGIHITLPLETKNPFKMRKNTDALVSLIGARGVSLIHARSRAPAWSAKAAAARTGIPFVTTYHGTYGMGPLGIKKPYNRVMADGDRVIAISEFIADLLRREYKTPEDRIRVIPRGIDLAMFDPERINPQRIVQISNKLGLTEAVPTVMLPGRLTAWKGHHLLIDALSILKRRNVIAELRCLMVGQDQGRTAYRESIETHAASAGVADWVHVLTDCGDLPAAYRVSDVIVSASTEPEAFGRVVAEAQAMGRPVVAPAHGAAGEIVIAGVTGWLFTPNDPLSLADALARALALSSAERIALAAQASANARANFDKAVMCAKTLAVYRELVGPA